MRTGLCLLLVAASAIFGGVVALAFCGGDDRRRDRLGRDGKVYVTVAGTKYHRSGCQSLTESQHAMTLGEAAGSYEPCSLCHP